MHIPEDVMDPVLDTLRSIDIMGKCSPGKFARKTKTCVLSDNPLVCDCDLQWYKNWVKNLKDKDEDVLQKKRTVCMMQHEHREYHLTDLPLEKMKCVIKPHDGVFNSGGASWQITVVLLLICKLVVLFH